VPGRALDASGLPSVRARKGAVRRSQGGIEHSTALRAAPERLDASPCPIEKAPLDAAAPLRVALHDLCAADVAPGTQPGTSGGARTFRSTTRRTNRPASGDAPIGTAQARTRQGTVAHARHEAPEPGLSS
jgi:hypothetical protein